MAKANYKIPASLDENYLSMEIAIQSKDGVGFKPLAVRVILVWLFGLLSLVYICINEKSIIAEAGYVMQAIFAIVWLLFIYFITRMDKSHRMQLELIPAMLIYMQKGNRTVITRKTANGAQFYGIVGIDSIDPESGMVTYMDGTYAYWYAVVGTASVLLFPEDRDAILNRVKDFYDKIGTDSEIIFMTTKEPQRVHKQVAHLVAQHKALTYKDPDINSLVREQYSVLKDFVGKEFKSLHQYMIIKGDTREGLSAINNIVMAESRGSSLMFKECVPMYSEDICDVLRLVYTDGQYM